MPSATIPTTTAATFSEDVLASPVPVLVDFTAPWCGPCLAMRPVLVATATERDDVRIVALDADRDIAFAAEHGVRGFPTFVLFAGGREVGRFTGALPRRRFEAVLDALLEDARVAPS